MKKKKKKNKKRKKFKKKIRENEKINEIGITFSPQLNKQTEDIMNHKKHSHLYQIAVDCIENTYIK